MQYVVLWIFYIFIVKYPMSQSTLQKPFTTIITGQINIHFGCESYGSALQDR